MRKLVFLVYCAAVLLAMIGAAHAYSEVCTETTQF